MPFPSINFDELPKWIQLIVREEWELQGSRALVEGKNIDSIFLFSNSRQGHDVWMDVERRDYDSLRERKKSNKVLPSLY